ncbi:MAG: PH domain-containing protein [Nocardioides sp.]
MSMTGSSAALPPGDEIATLREPARLVSPKATAYWRVKAGIAFVIESAVAVAIWWALGRFLDVDTWWRNAVVGLFIAISAIEVIVAPPIRYRIHRWEVTDEAVYTRRGWITTEQRIAPIARIQTVDSSQGALMRLFGLASITVTTASSAGALEIDCLDAETARRVVAELTEFTAATEGDGT